MKVRSDPEFNMEEKEQTEQAKVWAQQSRYCTTNP